MPIEVLLESGGLAGNITLENGQTLQMRGQVSAGRLTGKVIVGRGFHVRGRLANGELTGKIYNPFGSHSCGGKFVLKPVQNQ